MLIRFAILVGTVVGLSNAVDSTFAQTNTATAPTSDLDQHQARTVAISRLLPATTIAYAEIVSPAMLLETILEHPMRTAVESLDDVETALRSAEYIQFRLYLSWIELQLGMNWVETFQKLAANGLYAGFDAKHNGFVLAAWADDEATLTKVRETFLGMARRHAKRNDERLIYHEAPYGGYTGYEVGDLTFTQIGDRLFASNRRELLKSVVDNLEAAIADSLSAKTSFQEALTARTDHAASTDVNLERSDAWAYIDFDFVRRESKSSPLFRDKAENIVAEFLFGAFMESVSDASYLLTTASLRPEVFRWSARVPHDWSNTSAPRAYAFGKNGEAVAPFDLSAANDVLSLVAYRDLGQLWLAKEELLEEDQIAELAKTDGELTTVFSGLDFGEEVLGSVQPGFQILVARQDYAKTMLPKPDVRLPSFATVLRLKDPQRIQRRLKIGFQSLMGFVNIDQAQKGGPQFDVETERANGAMMTTANYFVDGEADGRINFNFSPTIAFVDDWFVVSSTKQFAEQLIDRARHPVERPSDANAEVTLDSRMLNELLEENREHLIAQNMLEDGNPREAAEKAISDMFALLHPIDGASLDVVAQPKSFQVRLDVDFNRAAKAALAE